MSKRTPLTSIDRKVSGRLKIGPDWWNLPRPKSTDRIHIRVEQKSDIPEPTPVPEINDIVIPLGWTQEPDRLRIGLAHVLQTEHAH